MSHDLPVASAQEKAIPTEEYRSGVVVKNIGEPIRLIGVNICGVTAESAHGPGDVKVCTRIALTSDDPIFHKIVENLCGVVTNFARKNGQHVILNRADSVLLVIHGDETADLWVDTAAVSMKVIVKREMKAGSVVFENDIADVTELNFPAIDILTTDRIVYIFREDWRFGLFFDFNPDDNLSPELMGKSLGTLFRSLKYRNLYDTIANEKLFSRLTKAGWFPFVEIMGNEFKAFIESCDAGFELDEAETRLLENFSEDRIDRLFARWINKPHFKLKERLLKSAVDAYKSQEPVAVLKIILTEIEGILAEAYKIATGRRAKIKTLLKFAVDSAERKVGGSDTLLFPTAFAEYLRTYTFADFDPTGQMGVAGSRHAVGHGAAEADSYTMARALQAILTLDQIAFYT